jgi:hypothetical protein
MSAYFGFGFDDDNFDDSHVDDSHFDDSHVDDFHINENINENVNDNIYNNSNETYQWFVESTCSLSISNINPVVHYDNSYDWTIEELENFISKISQKELCSKTFIQKLDLNKIKKIKFGDAYNIDKKYIGYSGSLMRVEYEFPVIGDIIRCNGLLYKVISNGLLTFDVCLV